jgi:hypothetical protein
MPDGTLTITTNDSTSPLVLGLTAVDGVIDFAEGFEGPGFENSWTIESGSCDDLYATPPAPLLGNWSCQISGVYGQIKSTYAMRNSFWLYAMVHTPDAGVAWSARIGVRSPIPDLLSAYIVITKQNPGSTFFQVGSFGGAVDFFGTPLFDTTYHIWFHYDSTTGQTDFYVDTTPMRPASPSSTIIGDIGISHEDVVAFSDTQPVIFDHIIVSANEIGATRNPWQPFHKPGASQS